MQKIVPHLWFDREAKEAAEFYTSVFDNSRVTSVNTMENTPSGTVDVVTFDLAGQTFTAISAGPRFKFNPSVSFLVACDSSSEVDQLWAQLSAGGQALMELGSYPFSERYGWTKDRYGVSWQVMLIRDQPIVKKITPALLFVGPVTGKAEEAINFYVSLFGDSRVSHVMRYGRGDPEPEGTVRYASFELEGQQFAAMDSALEHGFNFNEAISLMVYCEDQREIDYYWERLSAVPQAEACGWLKDKFGLSWQVVPRRMDEMMQSGDRAAVNRMTQAFLKMKKFDVAALERAYAG